MALKETPPKSEVEMLDQIELAFQKKLSYREWKAMEEREGQFHLQTALNREEFKRDIVELRSNSSYVVCDTFEEFLRYIPLLEDYDYPELEEIFRHEKEHWDQYIKEGLTPLVGFYFAHVDQVNHRKVLQVFTAPSSVPDEMTDEEYFAAMKRIIRAVSTLSDGDHRMLGYRENN